MSHFAICVLTVFLNVPKNEAFYSLGCVAAVGENVPFQGA